MDHFDSHHGLLLISMLFIVSTLALATTEAPAPTSFPRPSQTQQPESSPTPSEFPSLIQVGTPHDAGNERGLHGKAPQSLLESFIAGVPSNYLGPSPIMMPVSSPNASPELSPTSSSIPPFPETDYEEFEEYTDGGVQVSDVGPESEIEPNSLNSEEKGNPDAEVKKICDSTDHPSLCFESIFPLVKNQKETSANIVLDVSIKVANDLAKAAIVMTKKLGITPGVPPEIASVLKDCADSYDNALDNFEQAREAYATQDIGTLSTMLSAVITDISDCDDFFSTLNIPSPIAEFAEKLTNMTSNCLAIVSLLKS